MMDTLTHKQFRLKHKSRPARMSLNFGYLLTWMRNCSSYLTERMPGTPLPSLVIMYQMYLDRMQYQDRV